MYRTADDARLNTPYSPPPPGPHEPCGSRDEAPPRRPLTGIGSQGPAPGQSGAGALSPGRGSRLSLPSARGAGGPEATLLCSRWVVPLVSRPRAPGGTWPRPLWQQQDEASAEPVHSSSGAVTRRRRASMATGRGGPRAGSPGAAWRALQVWDRAGIVGAGSGEAGGLPDRPEVGCCCGGGRASGVCKVCSGGWGVRGGEGPKGGRHGCCQGQGHSLSSLGILRSRSRPWFHAWVIFPAFVFRLVL